MCKGSRNKYDPESFQIFQTKWTLNKQGALAKFLSFLSHHLSTPKVVNVKTHGRKKPNQCQPAIINFPSISRSSMGKTNESTQIKSSNVSPVEPTFSEARLSFVEQIHPDLTWAGGVPRRGAGGVKMQVQSKNHSFNTPVN